MIVYAIVGTSRVLSVGPESTTALLTAAVLAPLAVGDPARYAALAAMLALLVGGYALLAWVFRLGFIGDLLSKPVLTGYMAGVAIIMIASQLGKVTGVETAGDSFVAIVAFVRRRTSATGSRGSPWQSASASPCCPAGADPALPPHARSPSSSMLGATAVVAVFDLADNGCADRGRFRGGPARPWDSLR